MKVRVHWNLHKGGCVVRNVPNRPGDMRYTDSVCLRNVRFVVSESTMKRIQKEGVRSVGAWLEGELCECGKHDGVGIHFNPFRSWDFTRGDDQSAVHFADHVSIRSIGSGRGARPDTRAQWE